MKGLNYLATTVKTYRETIDTYLADPKNYRVLSRWRKELENVNPRGYCTGLYLDAHDASIKVRLIPPEFARLELELFTLPSEFNFLR